MPREHIVILDWSNEELIRKLKVKHDLDWREVDESVKWHRVGDPRWVLQQLPETSNIQ
ncbi:MAG: hypothetical protein KKE79_01920 [Actinobacteria bacterium]|nr:hypothetical protein [Actinomycetota bacterium]MCG2794891.1 hypothetical protein [Actinomycetes bacterium]